MRPFHWRLIVGRTDDHIGRLPTLDPIHYTQHDTVVRLVDPVGTPTDECTLTDLPRPKAPGTVSHTRHNEQPIEFVHLVASDTSLPGCVKYCDQKTFQFVYDSGRSLEDEKKYARSS